MLRLNIKHTTEYAYKQPVLYSIQQVRLTPREEAWQQVQEWTIQAPTKHACRPDHFDNTVCTFTLNKSHGKLVISAQGIVEIAPLEKGYLPNDADQFHPSIFTLATELTHASEAMEHFAHLHLSKGGNFSSKMLSLADAVADRVKYTKGSTSVADTAQMAFEAGKGVCQDHAHIMLACLRASGYSARYVSGYRYSKSAPEFASHAWIDVYDTDCDRWLSVDATHRSLVEGQHCRLAIARDYSGAAPVRGIRSGGGGETLNVKVDISAATLTEFSH